MRLGYRYIRSDMKSIQYLLYIAGAFKILTAWEAQFIIKTSSTSRINWRYSSLNKPFRETMTTIGRHLFSGFSIRVKSHIDIYHLSSRLCLFIVTVDSDIEPGTPSAPSPAPAPVRPRPRASGTFMPAKPHVHIKINPSGIKVSKMQRDLSRCKCFLRG